MDGDRSIKKYKFYCEDENHGVMKCEDQCDECSKHNCKHCDFLEKVFGEKMQSNREYWIWTEMFVYLHGSDECLGKKENDIKPV